MLKISIAVHGEGSNVELARRFVNILPRNTHLYLGGYWGSETVIFLRMF